MGDKTACSALSEEAVVVLNRVPGSRSEPSAVNKQYARMFKIT